MATRSLDSQNVLVVGVVIDSTHTRFPIKMYRNLTFCVHMHNLHPGANKFATPRK